MDITHHDHAAHRSGRSPVRLPLWLGFIGLLAIALFLPWGGHRVHVLGALPYAFLLLCPAMHLFMHGGHGNHQAAGAPAGDHQPGDHP